MLNQLGDESQSQFMKHVEQRFRILVQLVGELEEPWATFGSGEVPSVPQVQPSSSRINVHNDHLVSAKGDAQAGNASWKGKGLARVTPPTLNTHLPSPAAPLRTTRSDFV